MLETEPEWRLYEELKAHMIPFALQALAPKEIDAEDPVGRVWFRSESGVRTRYGGNVGFILQDASGQERWLAEVRRVVREMGRGTPS